MNTKIMSDFKKTLNLKEPLDKRSMPERQPIQTIERPVPNKSKLPFISRIVILAVILLGVAGCFYWSRLNSNNETVWQAVKLVNGEIFYGQVENSSKDPIIIKNVYYNYDQASNEKDAPENGNLRLVKRGKETYGPDGTMNIFKAQILYMEPLKEDSKVLAAIINYEKQ